MLEYSKEHTTNWNISDYDMDIILTALETYADLLEHWGLPEENGGDLCEYVEGLFQAMENHWAPEESE